LVKESKLRKSKATLLGKRKERSVTLNKWPPSVGELAFIVPFKNVYGIALFLQ
jgi:hypothetical protein